MRRSALLIAYLFLTDGVSAAEQRFAAIGDFEVVAGGIIKDCQVGYRVYGDLDDSTARIIVVPTWFTGTTENLEEFGVIGSGSLLDTDRYTVVSFDALGNSVSCSPSNSPEFPTISTGDMVRSQHLVLTEHLGINQVYAVVGISMGGMQAFRWLQMYPDFMDRAVPIDGTPRQTSFDVHNWDTQKYIVRAMQGAQMAETDIRKMLSRVGLLTYYTPDYFVENVPVEKLDEFRRQSDASYALDVDDYVSQLEAMISHDILTDGELRDLIGRVLIVGAASDHAVNQTPAREFAEASGVDYFNIDSICGHLGTSCENDAVRERVHAFLER